MFEFPQQSESTLRTSTARVCSIARLGVRPGLSCPDTSEWMDVERKIVNQEQEPLPLPQAVAGVLDVFKGAKLTATQRAALDKLKASLDKTKENMGRVRAARTRPGLRPIVDRDLVQRLRNEGLTLQQIGEQANTTPNNVSKILRALKAQQSAETKPA